VPYNYKGAKYNQSTAIFTQENKAKRDKNWQYFANVIGQKALPKLDRDGVFYRLPTVGATIKSGMLHTNVAFPGIGIEYKSQGQDWKTFTHPVKVSSVVELRSVSADGKRRGRTTQVSE
jgi:hexosaminidase